MIVKKNKKINVNKVKKKYGKIVCKLTKMKIKINKNKVQKRKYWKIQKILNIGILKNVKKLLKMMKIMLKVIIVWVLFIYRNLRQKKKMIKKKI